MLVRKGQILREHSVQSHMQAGRQDAYNRKGKGSQVLSDESMFSGRLLLGSSCFPKLWLPQAGVDGPELTQQVCLRYAVPSCSECLLRSLQDFWQSLSKADT